MAERYFDNVGQDLFKIGNTIAKNQKIARLLKYSDLNPLSADKPEIDGYSLIGKNITFVPYMEDDETVTESTVMILLDRFWQNRANKDFKLLRVRFNIICPMRSWVINDKALRPLMIMSEIDKLMNTARIAGIGTLEFDSADRLVISRYLSGYVVDYVCDSFN